MVPVAELFSPASPSYKGDGCLFPVFYPRQPAGQRMVGNVRGGAGPGFVEPRALKIVSVSLQLVLGY